jgi:hypothetical protein
MTRMGLKRPNPLPAQSNHLAHAQRAFLFCSLCEEIPLRQEPNQAFGYWYRSLQYTRSKFGFFRSIRVIRAPNPSVLDARTMVLPFAEGA